MATQMPVGRKVLQIGQCSVMQRDDDKRYYVLDAMAKEVGDCATLDAAGGIAELMTVAARAE